MSLLNTAVTGISAYQKQLDVTGNNISNADTPGYSRQEALTSSAPTIYRGVGYEGTGVQIDRIRRIADEFAIDQLRTDTQQFKGFESYRDNVEQINQLLGDERTGLNAALSEFYSALQTASETPGFIPSREALLGNAKILQDRFQVVSDRMQDQLKAVNSGIQANVQDINALVSGVADLNEQISYRQDASGRRQPNDLIDQRNEMLRQLSEIVDIEVVDAGATKDVYVGSGQALVLGLDARQLEVSGSPGDPTQNDVFFRNGAERINVTDRIQGGALGGVLDFREESLFPALNSLGRLAIGIAESFNTQQARGIDLAGNFGDDLFTDYNTRQLARDRVLPSSDNSRPQTGVAELYIEDVAAMTTSDYELRFTGPVDFGYEIVRLSDNEIVKSGALTGEQPESLRFDGLELRLTDGNFRQGDRVTLQPGRNMAGQFEQVLTRPEKLAFASPITAESSLANTGSGDINQGEILDAEAPAFAQPGELSPPVLIRFESPTRYTVLDNSDPLRPRDMQPPMRNLPFTPGVANDLFNTDPGQTQVTSYSGWLPTVPAVQEAGEADQWPDNDFNAERISFNRVSDDGGSELLERVSTPAGASAREVAASLSGVPGVNARAFTEMEVTNFQTARPAATAADPVTFSLNGVDLTIPGSDLSDNQQMFREGFIREVPDTVTPEFLANRINTNWELSELGITARSDGESLRIFSNSGDDLRLEVGGNPKVTGSADSRADSVEISNGQQVRLEATGADTRGLLTESAGFDFSERGPYTWRFETPYGEPAEIEMTGQYETGAEVTEAMARKIEAELISQERIKRNDPWLNGEDGPGRVEVNIDERGQVSFKVLMKMEGQAGNDTQRLTMGGTVDVVLDEGIDMETEPDRGNLFPGDPEQLSTFLGYQFQIDGDPQAGDRFEIDFNRDPSGDNRNAEKMVDLQTDKSLNRREGGMSFSEAYSQLAEQVGVQTRQAQINTDAAQATREQTENRIQEVSGVNLDEEAARLVRFEQGYNASAQMLRVAQEIFSTLLGTFR